MSETRIKSDFSVLKRADKLRVVQELWDEIGESPAGGALSAAQEKELNDRYARYQADPSRAVPWAEVEASLFQKG